MNSKMVLFSAKIHQLREEKKLYQKQLATALSIDTPMYSRIERGERRAKKEQISIIANILQIDPEELLALWLADQVRVVVSGERTIARKVLELVDNSLNNEY
jgi:transcriptional regulator with XRE-family HTH domain